MILVDTVYTYEMVRAFFRFHMFRGKHYKLNTTMFFLVSGLVTAAMILLFVLRNRAVLWYIFILMQIFDLLFLFLYFILPPMYYNRSKKYAEKNYIVEFKEKTIRLDGASIPASGYLELYYKGLHKVFETRDVVYMYITASQAFILPKKDFILGSPEELCRLLQRKIGADKYVVCK